MYGASKKKMQKYKINNWILGDGQQRGSGFATDGSDGGGWDAGDERERAEKVKMVRIAGMVVVEFWIICCKFAKNIPLS